MRKYTAIFRMRYLNVIQYRAAALGGAATQFAWGSMEILAFLAFYRANPSNFPMEFSEVSSYIWLQQAFLALFMMWFWEADIVKNITDGGVAYEMVRPVDLYNRWFFTITANRLARATLRCIPILLVGFILPSPIGLSLPPSLPQFGLFLVSTALALSVVAAFAMLVYISMFYTLSAMGTRMVAAILSDFLAGAIIPLPFFPENIRRVVEFLPFASMQNMPLRIYSGNVSGSDAIRGIALQLFWLITLVFIGKISIKRALRKVIVQGG
ncbi:MAG: ABC-2 family transporter protein [Defluviitaleaceae bacterium]|nr:ABC-2 family transporter protein [Defluviitaleaceae bacterium]